MATTQKALPTFITSSSKQSSAQSTRLMASVNMIQADTITDPRCIRNAVCTDWPGYFLKNQNSIVINSSGKMAKVKDTLNNVSFAPEGSKPRGGKPLHPTLTIGMSKDNPFHMHSSYTKSHPSTK